MKPIAFLSPLLFLFLLVSCQKTDHFENAIGNKEPLKEYASMEVSVVVCNPQEDPFCEDPVLLPGVQVFMYATEEDREYNDPILFQGVTNGSGKITFTQLNVSTRYYLKTVSNFGIENTSETTPNRGHAFHEVLFIQN
jgi:hypothetical protein